VQPKWIKWFEHLRNFQFSFYIYILLVLIYKMMLENTYFYMVYKLVTKEITPIFVNSGN